MTVNRFVPKPSKDKHVKRNVGLDFSPEEYAKIAELSKRHDCSIKSFCKQAVMFAIEQLETWEKPS